MQLKKVVNHGNVRWRVSTYVYGKRKQRFFESKTLASRWMTALKADKWCGSFWEDRTLEEKRDIINAFNYASKHRQSVYQSVLNPPSTQSPVSLNDAVCTYIDIIQQRSLRPASLSQIQLHLTQLAVEFANASCHEISSSKLERWFHDRKWKRSTIDGVIAKISPFFNWFIRENYCKSNPCKAVNRPRNDDSAPTIYLLPRLKNCFIQRLCMTQA